MGRLARVFVALLTAAGLLVYLGGVLGGLHWVLDLCTHFRPLLGILGGGLLVVSALQRRWVVVAANLGLLAGVLPGVAPLYRAEVPPAGERLVVLVANVNCFRGDPPQVLDLLQKSDADVVALIEIDQRWMAALEPALARWPHRVVHPYQGTFGLGVFSRLPLTGEALTAGPASVPTIRARLEAPGGPVGLLVVHPKPPVSGAAAAGRDADLMAFADLVAGLGPRPMILGDLNATPWSAPFRRLIAATGLREARDVAGAGVAGTWPSQLPDFLRIPIDHVLVGGDLGVAEFTVGEAIGSDHRPLRAVVVTP